MKKTIKRMLSLTLILLCVVSVLPLSAFALEWDGSSGGGAGTGHQADVDGYAVRFYPEDNCIGYRFSVVDKNGYNVSSKCIDVFRDTYWGKNGYTANYKFDKKYNKARLIDYQTGSYSTSKNTVNCIMESDMGFITGLSTPDRMEIWQAYNGNLNAVLWELGIGTIDDLSNGDKILVEPIFDVKIEKIYHAVTATEIAIYGAYFLGMDSNGGANAHADTWGFISNPTNKVYPNSLFTPDGQGLWPGAAELTKKATFRTIINYGYGVGIAYSEERETFSPQLSVKEVRAYKGTQPSKTFHYGTSIGNAFGYYTYDKGYPAYGDNVFFTVVFPKESENVRVRQSVWVDGTFIGSRTGYSYSLELYDVSPTPLKCSKDKSYYQIVGRVDWIDDNGNTLEYGVLKEFYVPVKPTVYRYKVTAFNVVGEEQAYSGMDGSSGKVYVGQKLYTKYNYTCDNSWYSYNNFDAASSKEKYTFSSEEEMISASYPRNFKSTGGYVTVPNDGATNLRFTMNSEWDKDPIHTKESNTYSIPVVKADVELSDIRIVGPDGLYVDPNELTCGVLYHVYYVYKNNTDCTVFVDGFDDSEEKINGDGVYVISPNSSILVVGGSFMIPSPTTVEIWGGVFLYGAGIHNTEWESDGTNNEMTIKVRANVALALEAIIPNAPYRETTTVFTSYWLKNNNAVNIKPTDNVSVDIQIFKADGTAVSSATKSALVVPANDMNLIFFKWKVPSGLKGKNVKIVATLKQNGTAVDTVTKNYETVPYNVYSTPDTQYEKKAPAGFSAAAAPPNSKEYASWWEYSYENGKYVKNTYKMTIASTGYAQVTPATGETAVKHGDEWEMKSGYGISLKGYATVANVNGYTAANSARYTLPQYALAMFPEFSFASGEGVSRTPAKTGSYWVFRQNATYGPVHFTPLYYPDGVYQIMVRYSDMWTPAGMISATFRSNEITINGNAYDDWYIGRH